MSKQLPRKALIAVSSFNGAIYPGGHKTGVSITSGCVVTGTNPASGRSATERGVKLP